MCYSAIGGLANAKPNREKGTDMLGDELIACPTPRQKKAGVQTVVFKVLENNRFSGVTVVTLVITKNKRGKFYVSGRYFRMYHKDDEKWEVMRMVPSSSLYGEYDTMGWAKDRVWSLIEKRGVGFGSHMAIVFAACAAKGEIRCCTMP